MKNLTPSIMKKLITILITAFFIVTMVGCGKDEANIKPSKTETVKVGFDLPEGWTWLDEETLEAILEKPSADGNAPFVKLEFGGIQKGDVEQAAKTAEATYTQQKESCDAAGKECEIAPELKQFTLNETEVSAAMYAGYVWGNPSWNSHITFEKNGYIVEFMLYDKADLYKEELETIVSSVRW